MVAKHTKLYQAAWTTWLLARQMEPKFRVLLNETLFCVTELTLRQARGSSKCPKASQWTIVSWLDAEERDWSAKNTSQSLRETAQQLESSTMNLHHATAKYIGRFKLLRSHEVRNLKRWHCDNYRDIEGKEAVVLEEFEDEMNKAVDEMQPEYKEAHWLVDERQIEDELRKADFVVEFLKELIAFNEEEGDTEKNLFTV